VTENLKPLPPDDWDPSLDAIRADLGTPLNIHNVFARHPDLLRAWMPFRNHVVRTSSLTGRQRELLILRNAHNTGARYEWDHHVVRGRAAGLTDDEIARVKSGPAAADWTDEEALLLTAADAMRAGQRFSPETWQALCQRFDDRQILDIIVTVGMYMLLSTVVNTGQVPMEDDH
jgi:4-carboxymuconolactone decarboxylase